MRIVVCGSRSLNDYDEMWKAYLDSPFYGKIKLIVSGNARGGDQLGIQLASELEVPIRIFNPDWDKYGKKAGILRNCDMGRLADGCLALYDGSSRGTYHMFTYMGALGKPTFVRTVDNVA